jgi:hypothetical protein
MVTAPRIVFASIRLLKCSRSSCFLLGACLVGVCSGVFVFGVGEMHIYDFDLCVCRVYRIFPSRAVCATCRSKYRAVCELSNPIKNNSAAVVLGLLSMVGRVTGWGRLVRLVFVSLRTT